MAIEVKGTDIIDDNRNIVGANTYNGYVPVNPTRAIYSGNGIVGGGNLGADRTLSIRAGDGLTANTTGIHIVAGNGLSVSSSNVYVDEAFFNSRYANYRLLNNTALTFSEQIGIPANTGGVVVYGHAQAGAPSDSPSNLQGAGIYITNPWREHQLHFDANYKVFHKSGTNVDEFWTTRNLPNPANTATSIVAGNGLTGGGNLTASRTLNVGAGDGISVLATTVNVDNTVVRTSDTKNYSTTGSVTADGLTSTNGLTISSGGLNVTGNSTLSGTLNVNSLIVAKSSIYVEAANANMHLLFREASNSAFRGLYYYDNANHALRTTLYSADNSSVAVARTDLFDDRFASSVPFTGSGSGLTNLPATSLTGTIDDARIPTTVVRTSRTVTAGAGLTGGGALSGNLTLTVGRGDGITVNATNVAVDSTVVRTSRTVTAGAGLTGGGNLGSNVTLTVGSGDGITVGATTVSVDSTVVRNVDNKNYVTTGGITSDGGSLSTRTANSNAHLWYRDSSNNATRVVAFYNRSTHDYRVQLYQEANTSLVASNLILSDSSLTSSVPFTGSGSGLTNIPATSLTGTIDDARLPTTAVRTSRTVTAGNGLTGGGGLSANITLTVGKGDGITVNATNVAVDSTVVRTSRTVTAGNGLTGGGNLGSNVTLTVGAGNGIAVGSTSIAVNAGNGLVSNSTGVHVQTGNGMTQNSSHVYVVAGDGITATSTGVAVDNSVVRTSGPQTINGVVTATGFAGNGTSLTTLNATQLYGTVNIDRLPSVVARKDIAETFGSTLTVNGGSVYISSGGNQHLWFQSGSRTTGLIWSSPTADRLSLRSYNAAGTSYREAALTSNGTFISPSFEGDGSGLTNVTATNLSRQIVAGSGLTGGGTLNTDRTITLGTPTTITDSSTNVVTSTSHTHVLDDASINRIISRFGTGVVGSYALLQLEGGGAAIPGQNIAASAFRGYTSTSGDKIGGTPAGTWRCMGMASGSSNGDRSTLYLRIS